MLSNLSVRKKLFFSVGAILAIVLVLLTTAYINFARLSEASRLDRHSMEVLQALDRLHTDLLQVQVEARGYYLTGTEQRLVRTNAELADLPASVQRLRTLTADNPNQRSHLDQFDAGLRTWIKDVLEPQLERRRSLGDRPDAAFTLARMPELAHGSPLTARLNAMLDDARAEEKRLLGERSQVAAQQQQTMVLVLTVGGLLCLASSMLVAWLLARALLTPLGGLTAAVGRIAAGESGARAPVLGRDELGLVTQEFNRMAQAIEDNLARELAATNTLRAKVDALLGVVSKAAAGDLTGQVTVTGEDAVGQLGHGVAAMLANLRALINNVQKAGIQVASSATEIAASSRQQEVTGVEQAQTSVEILSTTKEISANTSALLKTMEQATAVADYTTSATADAQANLQRMDGTMQHMVAATDSINAKLAALSEKASNINSVLVTITKVADQTNILSLNAAIEAEKAGEAGRGFSVVATEIRRLADQTSVSTWDIEQMLKEMQSAVSASVMGMDKFSEEIRRSVGEVRQVTEQLSGVMDQVQKLAPQFDAVLQGMQSQAVGAEQISSTMGQLNDATQQTVESLKATSEAVRKLQYAAGDLQSGVGNFTLAA
ncbi:methyl-accepting chemotaxis protein [Rugamonas apoptosis]|uniref:CHASE3 domain-containing protein n=1 Tax=Rugamonas apoptosis TaxID=2758570 RepID=A0A7W2FET0_9BURK|nr:methyl-accepting chemotaxis protein [Rugamonas apoptosis]MBA5690370.1 CHASE3 domain-containing protein [Rugamonas apoptosis]